MTLSREVFLKNYKELCKELCMHFMKKPYLYIAGIEKHTRGVFNLHAGVQILSTNNVPVINFIQRDPPHSKMNFMSGLWQRKIHWSEKFNHIYRNKDICIFRGVNFLVSTVTCLFVTHSTGVWEMLQKSGAVILMIPYVND